jgi:aspartyl-tRNA synthetase
MSAKLVFIVFRQQMITIQGVLQSFQPHSAGGRKLKSKIRNQNPKSLLTFLAAPNGTIPERMVRSVERYPHETIVVVHAKLRKAPQRIKNATIHDYELEVYEVHKVVNLAENVPFSVYDAENINRDKEDVDEGDDAGEETSTPMSPLESEDVSLKSQDLSRRSTDMSRVSQDLLSRSKPTHDSRSPALTLRR